MQDKELNAQRAVFFSNVARFLEAIFSGNKLVLCPSLSGILFIKITLAHNWNFV
jgi:hypothetical protein